MLLKPVMKRKCQKQLKKKDSLYAIEQIQGNCRFLVRHKTSEKTGGQHLKSTETSTLSTLNSIASENNFLKQRQNKNFLKIE